MAREQFDLIVFDWDGTLMDSTAHITRSIQAACRDLGLPVPGDDAASYVIGLGLREALQIGPLVAKDAETAQHLFAAALGRAEGPVYVDIADHAAPLQQWALAQGFAVQRPFTRMAHGPRGYAPGDASLVYCPAGPELG